MRKSTGSRGDKLLQLEKEELMPLHETQKKQPTIFEKLSKPINRRGNETKKRRCFIDDEDEEDENVLNQPKVIKLDEEESFLDDEPLEFKSPEKLKIPQAKITSTTTSNQNSDPSSNPPTSKMKFRVSLKPQPFASSTAELELVGALVEKALKAEPVVAKIAEKKKEDICLEPQVSIGVKGHDGAVDVLPLDETIGDCIDTEKGEHERLVFSIREWKVVQPTFEGLFDRHRAVCETPPDPELVQSVASASENGNLKLKSVSQGLNPLFRVLVTLYWPVWPGRSELDLWLGLFSIRYRFFEKY